MTRTLVPMVAGMVALAATACDRTPAEPASADLAAAEASRVASSAARGAPTPDTAHARRARHHGPIAWILARSDEFDLTAEQVSRLESIQRDLKTKNRPLMERIHAALGPGTPGPRRLHRGRLTPEQHAAIAPLMEQIHENVRAALQEVRAVLGGEQWDRIKAVRDRHQSGRAGRHGWRHSHHATPPGSTDPAH